MLNTMKRQVATGFVKQLVEPGILILLILIGYGFSLKFGFVSDDIQTILLDLPRSTWQQISSDPYFLLRPTRILYFFLYQLVGTVPQWYRLLNILFHAGTTLFVYLIVRRLVGRRAGFLSSCIVAIHPMMIESVTWISGGVYAQYGMLFLASFWVFLRSHRQNGRVSYSGLAGSLLLLVGAMLFSEKAAVLFILFFLWTWSYGIGKKRIVHLIPFVLFSAIFILYYLSQLSGRISGVTQVIGGSNTSLTNPFYQIPIALGSYIRLFFWPISLSFYHDDTFISILNYIPSLILVVVGAVGTILAWRRNKPLAFWLSWIIIPLLPTLTPFRIAWISAERYAYLTVIGLSVSTVMCVGFVEQELKRRFPVHKHRLAAAGVVFWTVVIALLTVRTVMRNLDWRTADTLWIATANTAPNVPYTWNNMGDVYARRGQYEQAARMFERAIRLNPRYADAYHNLGQTYEDMDQPGDAILLYKRALEVNPDLWQSHVALARLYARNNDYVSALSHIEAALALQPDNIQLQEARSRLNMLLNTSGAR